MGSNFAGQKANKTIGQLSQQVLTQHAQMIAQANRLVLMAQQKFGYTRPQAVQFVKENADELLSG